MLMRQLIKEIFDRSVGRIFNMAGEVSGGLTKIDSVIYLVRGQKVMLDADLALLYGVDTRELIQAIRRN